MSKLYIIEGPDGAGKTTLARRMAKDLNGIYFHCTASPRLFPGLADYHWNILENVQENVSSNIPIILDRFWPSEHVYGSLFRPMSEYPWRKMHDEVTLYRHCYIFCTDDGQSWSEDHDDPAHKLTSMQHERVVTGYDNLHRKMEELDQANVFLYDKHSDGTEMNLPNFIQMIK